MRGVWTALVTPFNKNNELDIEAFRNILENQVEARVAGVIPCGTTGESPTLNSEEKKTLIRTAIEALKGTGTQVAAGTGSNNTSETLEFSEWASAEGVDAILVVTPYYNKPSQAGLASHFLAVAERVDCEVILYNVPSRTGVSLTPETICELSRHPRVRTLKEATGNVAFTSEILDALSRSDLKMDVLSGDDATYLPLLAVGAVGVISVASNLIPRTLVEIQNAMDDGKQERALEIHREFYPVFRDLFIESNPVPVKYAMSRVGWCEPRVRAPLTGMSEANLGKLELTLNRLGIQKGSRL